MRRILNLNQPSMAFIKIIALFILVIPIILYGILFLWNEVEIISSLLVRMIRISFGIGAFVFVVWFVLILLEQIQDHVIDVQYQKSKDRKRSLGDGNYECQYCGNQKVEKNDKTCGVCGKALK